jgi:hypothetical protein
VPVSRLVFCELIELYGICVVSLLVCQKLEVFLDVMVV